jgi:SAM-dependent methyltransferase
MHAAIRLLSRAIRAWQAWLAFRRPPLGALRTRRPGRGLDVGCGRGDLAAALVRRGWSMTGVEPSVEACRAAAARGIDARCGTLRSIELAPGEFDAIIFHHSLEHTNDPIGELRIAARALAPGGLVLITIPNFGGWQARRFGSHWYHLDLPRHRVHFTPDVVAHAFATTGLEQLESGTSSSAVGLPASLQYRVASRCLFPSGLGLRVASGLCTAALPITIALDRVCNEGGDLLHALARRDEAGAAHDRADERS